MRRAIAKFVVLALALAAVADNAAAASSRTKPSTVRIEVPGARNLQFFTLWVALGAGLFQKEGLEPEIVVASNPRSTGQRLLAGDADVALLPPPMFLGMIAEDKPILLFASLLANEPINLVVSRHIAEARGLSARATLEERLQAIKGLEIGLAREVTPRLRVLAASAGLDADRDFHLIVIPGPAQIRAFADGEVEALFSHTPYLETALVEHGALLVAEPSSGSIPALADGQVHALATTRARAREKTAVIDAVTRAILRAQRLIHSNPEASVNALIASGAGAGDRRLLEAMTAVYGAAVPQTPHVSLDGIVRDAALYPAHPRTPDFRHVDAAHYVADDFARRAVEVLR